MEAVSGFVDNNDIPLLSSEETFEQGHRGSMHFFAIPNRHGANPIMQLNETRGIFMRPTLPVAKWLRALPDTGPRAASCI